MLCIALLALAGCGGSKPQARKPSPPPAQHAWPMVEADDPAAANSVLMRAIGLVGTPYRYGGNTPEAGFDCSGLVTYVYRDMLDLRLPRTSRELAQVQGPKIEPRRLAPIWCSSAARATSHTWASMWAKAGSCMRPAPAGRSDWTVWTVPTGGTITAARNACFVRIRSTL